MEGTIESDANHHAHPDLVCAEAGTSGFTVCKPLMDRVNTLNDNVEETYQ